jgi:type II secretory pathway component PulJ
MTRAEAFRRVRSRAGRRGAEGMTIIELTVAAAVLMVILVPVFAFLATAQRSQSRNQNATTEQADTRLALQEMTRFLREAEYPQGTTYATTNSDLFASTPSATDITFFSEIGAVQGTGTIDKIDYSLSGSTLTQTVTAPTDPNCTNSCAYGGTVTHRTVLSDLVNQSLTGCTNLSTAVPLFNYYQQDLDNGQLTPQGNTGNAETNYVSITVVTGPPSGQTGACNQVQTAVSLRNWRPGTTQ